MLLLLAGALALSLFWFLIGRGFLALAGFDAIHDPDTVEWEMLTGAFVLAAAGQAVHFVLPLPSGISAVVLGVLFAVVAVVRRRDISWLVDRVKGAIHGRPRLVIAFLCIAVVIALSAARPCKVEDTANYHAQVLRWADAARLVPGLALVHGRLAFNSLWFPLEAMTSLAFLSNGPLPLVNTTTFLIGALYLFRQIVAGEVSRLAARLALGAFLPYIAAGFFYAGSLSPDLPALTYGLLAFFAVARALESRTAVLSALAVCLVVAAASWKLSTAPLLLFVPFLLWDRWVVTRGRIEKRWIFVGAFLLAVGLMLVARSVILSGYPLYPSTALDVFPVGWKAPWLAHGHEIGIRVFARGLRTQNPTEAVTYPLSQWFPVWIRNLNNTARVCLAFLAVGVALLFPSMLNPATRRWLAEGNRRALFAITTVALLSSAFWFFEAPDVRFGASYLSVLAAICYLPWLWPIDRAASAPYRIVASVVVIAAVGLVAENILVADPVPPWCSAEYARTHPNRLYWFRPASYPEAAFVDEWLRDGSLNHVVMSGGLAHYGAVPNSPLPIAGIAVRRGPQLSDGYRLDVD